MWKYRALVSRPFCSFAESEVRIIRPALTLVGIPAFLARSSPCTPALFEMTSAIWAQLSCRKLWSIKACRLVPEPEINTPTRMRCLATASPLLSFSFLTAPSTLAEGLRARSVLDAANASISDRLSILTLLSGSSQRTTSPITQALCPSLRLRRSRTMAASDWSTTNTAPTPQLNVRAISAVETFPCADNQPNTGGRSQADAFRTTPVPWGSTLGMFSTRPPPWKETQASTERLTAWTSVSWEWKG